MKDLAQYNPQVQVAKEAAQRLLFDPHTGFPQNLFRADMLPRALPLSQADLPGHLEALNAAQIPLDISLGYPVLPGLGLPIWSHLPWEPLEQYQWFQEFLELPQPRVLTNLQRRQLQDQHQPQVGAIQEAFHLYMWGPRARAYDIFLVQERAHKRALRRRDTEESQYTLSEELLDKALNYIRGDEFEALLTPKVALELLRTGISLGRINSGLPANAPLEQSRGSNGAELSPAFGGPDQGSETASGMDLDLLLGDPNTAEMAQELVIRIRHQQRQLKGVQDAYRNEGRLDRTPQTLEGTADYEE